MSESSDLVNELRRLGVNYQAIGEAVGRNRSLIRQVGIGAKPGNNLRDALAELRDRLAALAPGERTRASAAAPVTAAPARRTTASGREARLRQRITHGGRGRWSASNIKRQASRSGARSLGKVLESAADDGMDLAVTITFDRSVSVASYGRGKRGIPGAGGTLDVQLSPDEYMASVLNPAAYMVSQALASGQLSGHGNDPNAYVAHINSIELRAF
jgi:hypothetical protein